jgi:proline dehydrogenase
VDDAPSLARDLVAGGFRVALDHVPRQDPLAEIRELVARLARDGTAGSCELTVPVGAVGPAAARLLDAAAEDAGVGVLLAGPAPVVDSLAPELPGAGVAVRAGEPGAEERCRRLAGRRVRLTRRRGAAADLAFVRCLNVLMAGVGRPEVASADPRMIAIAGERAAWNGRTPDSWEHLMPYGVRLDEQRRLVAAGFTVRVAVPAGAGAPVPAGLSAVVARLLGGRS